MKDKQLRRMLADTLKYLKKRDGQWIEREDVEVNVETYYTNCNNVSIAEIIDGIDPKDYDGMFIRGIVYEDYDGYFTSELELYHFRKQTDKEYFDSICQYLLPTGYQQEQYQQYLRLKKMYEGEG